MAPLSALAVPRAVEIRQQPRMPVDLHASAEALLAAHETRWCAQHGLTPDQLDARAKIAAAAAGDVP